MNSNPSPADGRATARSAAPTVGVTGRPPVMRRRWPIVAGFLLVALSLLAFPVLGYLYVVWAADRDVELAIAEIEERDPRWRLDDMMADRKPIADADNSALVVGKVDAFFRPRTYDIGEKNARQIDKQSSVHRLNDLQVAALRETLTKHAEAVKLARTLKDFSGEGRYGIKIAPDYLSTNAEALQRCRGVMAILQHDAMLRAEDEDAAGALESCQAILAAARSVGDEPFLTAALVRIAGHQLLAVAVERTLAQGEPPAEHLRAMQDLLGKEIDAEYFQFAMRGERGGADMLLNHLRKGGVPFSTVTGSRGGGPDDWLLATFPGLLLSGRAEHLRLMTRAVEAGKLPPEKQAAEFDKIDQATRVSGSLVTKLLMPAIGRVSLAHRRTLAQLRCTWAGVAAERYRRDRGDWPASLEELAKNGLLPSVPLDPFDGQPLRYKILADGVLIYSIGADGVDNGGLIDRANPNAPGTDVGFRLWHPEHRRQEPLPPLPDDDAGGPP